MRNVFLLLLGLVFFNTNAQKMSAAFLEGKWTSDEGAVMIIKGTNKNKLVIRKELPKGDSLKVVRYYLDKKNLYVETLFESTKFEAVAKFFIIDQDTMVADIVSEQPGQVTYKRTLKP